ncbi:hypothetical protein ACQ4XT_11390 [Halobacillus faecis]
MLIGKVEQFKSFSQFDSLKDFNNNIEQWLLEYKHDFTKKELVCLKRLYRFCSKVFGVSTISINKLLAAIEEKDQVKVSEATFHRFKRKAIKLGLLSVHATKRVNDSQSSNVWIFNKYDTPCETEKAIEQQTEKQEKTSPKTSKLFKTTKHKRERKELTHEYVSSNVPESLVNAIKSHFNDAETIYKVWHRLSIVCRKQSSETLKYDYIDEFVKTYREVIGRHKQNKIKGDWMGYLYSAFCIKCSEINRMIGANESELFSWFKEVVEV